MKNDKSNKGNHLSLDDRHYIEEVLNQKCSLKEIAKSLGKAPTTISKEIIRNRIASNRNKQLEFISCSNRRACTQKHICNKTCYQLCKKCKMLNCFRICPDYTSIKCINFTFFTHVCNSCKRGTICHIEKQYYRAKVADTNYHELLNLTLAYL